MKFKRDFKLILICELINIYRETLLNKYGLELAWEE